MHLERKEQVPPAPLSVPDTFRTTQDKIKTNRRISIDSAVFATIKLQRAKGSCLKMTTQDRHRTKRPPRTAIRYYVLHGISEQPQNHWSEKSSEETV